MVGHALSLIVIQSGGARRVLESRPELVRDALGSIEATGRQALTDMERMLDMLRAPEASEEALNPQPSLSEVYVLAARVFEAGLPVDVAVEGEPVPLPPSVDLSAYRIIQEALTNTLKHAGPARAGVSIRYGPDSIELEIVDDGKGASSDGADEHRGGRGLIGMKERVALFSGELTAGSRPEGGFRVHARLPLTGSRP
jgi:signal transduction histidine kinase